MKIINFGSLNIDRVYSVSQFVTEGETVLAEGLQLFAGGKGLNQSIAAARAGAVVVHGGAIGAEGDFLLDILRADKVNTDNILHSSEETGHAVIQVNSNGQNCIIVYGGANQTLDKAYIEKVLECAEKGDIVLLQNETSAVSEIIRAAHARGLYIVFNPSPFPKNVSGVPFELVNCFMINEIEGAALATLPVSSAPEIIIEKLAELYPASSVVLTLGSKGVTYADKENRYSHSAYTVSAVDTTAAGDTFCGYFLAGLCKQKPIPLCLQEASAAAAIAVSKAGAAPSIPVRSQVEQFLQR